MLMLMQPNMQLLFIAAGVHVHLLVQTVSRSFSKQLISSQLVAVYAVA